MKIPIRVATNTLVQFLGRLLTSAVTFVATILIAHKLGAEGYGNFTKITNFVALFYLVADFGFNAVFLQERDSRFAKLFTLRLFVSLVLVFGSIATSFFLPFDNNQGFTPYVRQGILLYSLTIVGQAIFTSTNAIFQKNLIYSKSVFASSFGSFLTLMLLISMYQSFSLTSLLSIFIAGSLATAGMSLFLIKDYTRIALDFDFAFMKHLVIKTLPLGATLIFNLVYFRADWFLLSLFRTTTEVGIYGLAYKFFEFPLSLPIFFMNSLYPILILHQQEGKDVLKKTIGIATVASLLISLLLAMLLFIAAPLFTLIRQEFSSSILAFRILILGLPLFFLSSLFQWVIITLEKQKLLAFVYFFSMMFNIAANVLYIPQYGLIAAAIITDISEAFVLLTLFSIVVRQLHHGERK